MNVLVTGGLGYIGSHTVLTLIEQGHTVIVADNLSNSKLETLQIIEAYIGAKITFYRVDVTNEVQLQTIFDEHTIDAVIHLAGDKAVSESTHNPLKYYWNNVVSTIVLAKVCQQYNVKKFIFSSSATVYGNNDAPFYESMPLLPTTNPYGETKVMGEKILMDLVQSDPMFEVTLLRYFNPIGAHPSGIIGEMPNSVPNNLMPYILDVAIGNLPVLQIFGDDYLTEDGTGVRDYIHVVDLAKGHVAALENSTPGIHIYNLGTGKGTSVLQLISTFEQVNGVKVPYMIVDRRPGDLAICYANVDKARWEIGWTAKCTVEDMCKDSWRFKINYSMKR